MESPFRLTILSRVIVEAREEKNEPIIPDPRQPGQENEAMWKRSWRFGGVLVLLAVLGLSLGGRADPPKSEPAEPRDFTGKAISISLRGNGGQVGLLDPEVKPVGDRIFLTGRPVLDWRTKPLRLWIPLADVGMIEEFANEEEMAKWYQVRRVPKKD
jgi:hypothetical protein